MVAMIKFQFGEQALRIQNDEAGEPLFHAGDVCDALGFGNPRQALSSHVDSEDVHLMDTLTTGGSQVANFITESGLYALIFGSKLAGLDIPSRDQISGRAPLILSLMIARRSSAMAMESPSFSNSA